MKLPKPPNNPSHWKALLCLLLFVGAIAVGVFVIAWIPPMENAWLPSCPFLKVTGLYCPGCGSTRASHFLLKGEFLKSLRYHPFILPLLPMMGLLFYRFFYESITEKEWHLPGLRFFSLALLILLLVFWILRNIPLVFFDLLRPPY